MEISPYTNVAQLRVPGYAGAYWYPHHIHVMDSRRPGVLIVKYFTQFIAHEDLRRKIFVVAQLSHRNKVLVCSFWLAATFLCALSTFSLYLDELFSDSFHSPNIAC